MEKFTQGIFWFWSNIISPMILLSSPGKEKTIIKVGNASFLIRKKSLDLITLWETWKLKEYDSHDFKIGETDVVVDIGAQIGDFSVYSAKKATKSMVFGFEPESENFGILKRNKQLNSVANLKIFRLAVSDKNGKEKLFVSANNTGGHSMLQKIGKGSEVKAITLKNFFVTQRLKRINFLKIDTEGGEYKILPAIPISILKKIDKIVLEYHTLPETDWSPEKLKELLERAGFQTRFEGLKLQRVIFGTGILKAWR